MNWSASKVQRQPFGSLGYKLLKKKFWKRKKQNGLYRQIDTVKAKGIGSNCCIQNILLMPILNPLLQAMWHMKKSFMKVWDLTNSPKTKMKETLSLKIL